MAERRMFAKTIVLSDEFLDMPLGARCIYMTMGMMADDDGFVNNAKTIIRMTGATEDDLKVLIAKKFIIPFEDGVIVIKHWRINNYLRNDRHVDTKYLEHKASLLIDDKGAYSKPKSGVGIPGGIPNSGIPSIDKDSINNIYCAHFEETYRVYPRKGDKKRAYACYKARIKEGYSEDELHEATLNYAKYCEKEKREQKYIKTAPTFFGVNTPFVDYLPKNTVPSEPEHNIFDVQEQYNAPFFGFPKEWFDGDKLVKERVKPVIRPKNLKMGWYEETEISVDDLIFDYEARRQYYDENNS